MCSACRAHTPRHTSTDPRQQGSDFLLAVVEFLRQRQDVGDSGLGTCLGSRPTGPWGLFPSVQGAICPGRYSKDLDCEATASTDLPYRHITQLVLQRGRGAAEQRDASWNTKKMGFKGSQQTSQLQQATSMCTTVPLHSQKRMSPEQTVAGKVSMLEVRDR